METATATADTFKKIDISQVPDTLNSPVAGKFYAYDPDIANENPWIGIVKPETGDPLTCSFNTKFGLYGWLGGDGMVAPTVESETVSAVVDDFYSTGPLTVDEIPAEYAERVDSLLRINPVDPVQEKIIRKNFAHYFRDLGKLTAQSRAIVVSDRTDKAGMAAARDLRLQFKNIRVSAEKVRKSLKEESIRYGRVVDGSYKLIGEPCAAEEEHLQAQEDFEKNLIAAEKERVRLARAAELEPFVESTAHFNLEDMSDEQFQLLLIGSRTTFEQKQAYLAEQAENDRAESVRKQRKIDRINVLSAIGLSFDGVQYAYGDIGLSETAVDALTDDEFDAKVDEINTVVAGLKAARQAEIEADRAEHERLQKIADAQAKAEADAAADAERMRLAPDVDKLLAFAERIRALTLDLPEVDSGYDGLLNQVEDRLNGTVEHIRRSVGA